MQKNNYTEIMEKNHMEIPWHDYARKDNDILINNADLIEKASVIGRVGLIMLSCGTRCLACSYFYEPAFTRIRSDLYSRCRPHVH